MCKTKLNRLLVLIVGLLTMCVTQVRGALTPGDVYTKVTDISSLSDGDEVIFVNASGTSAMSTTQNTNNRGSVSITTSNGSWTCPTTAPAVQVLVVKIPTSGKYGFHTGSGYLYSASTSNNYLKTTTTAISTAPTTTSLWTLAIAASGNTSKAVTIKNNTNTSYYIQWNSTTVSQYKNTQTNGCIYKKAPASVPYTVTLNAGTNGTCSTSSLKEASAGAGVTLPAATPKTGYRFVGWSTSSTPTSADAGEAGDTYKPSSNCTLYAYYVQTHIVNWYVNGSAIPQTVDHGASLAIPDGIDTDIECGGKVFVGWCTAASYSNPTTAPTGMFTSASGTVDANANYYAVYATASAGGAAPTAYTAGAIGNYVLAVYVNSKWYALPNNPTVSSGKITGVEITVNTTASSVNYVTTANATGYTWTIANATNGQTISDGTKYIYHANGGASGTNLEYGTKTTITWKIESEANGLTFQAMSGSTVNNRGMLGSNSTFGGYALSNEDQNGYYRIQVLPIGGGTTYSNYTTTCGPATYTASVADGLINGSINLSASDSKALNALDGGETITINLTPETGYEVGTVTVTKAGGGTVETSGTGNTRTFTMPKDNVTVSATFVAKKPTSFTLISSEGYDITVGGETTISVSSWEPADLLDAQKGVTYSVKAGQESYASVNASTGLVTTLAVCANCTIVATSAADNNVTAEYVIHINAPSNFTNGQTIFIHADGNSSAWDASACVKAWFNNNGSGGAAQQTYWVFDGADYKVFATQVPTTGDLDQLTLQRFSSDCNTHWNDNGSVKQSDRGDKTTVLTNGSGTSNVSWHNDLYKVYLHGSTNSWDAIGELTDQMDGTFKYTISNYAATGTDPEFKLKDSYNHWWGDENYVLTDTRVGSVYNIDAKVDFKQNGPALYMSKTLVSATVSFDKNGHGDANPAAQAGIAAGGKATAPTNPTEAGWSVVSWHTDAECTSAPWNFATDEVTESMTLYAKWNDNRIFITWSVNGENWNTEHGTPTTILNAAGKITNMPTDPTSVACDGEKVFVGWTTAEYEESDVAPATLYKTVGDFAAVTGNTTYYAVFATQNGSGSVTSTKSWTGTDVTQETFSTYSEDEDNLTLNGNVWTAKGHSIAQYQYVKLGKGCANYMQTPSSTENISSVSVTWYQTTDYYLSLQTTTGTELEAHQSTSNASATPQTYVFNVSGSYQQLRLVARRAAGTKECENALATISAITVNYGEPTTYSEYATACSDERTVTFNMHGHGTQTPSTRVAIGNTITKPSDPEANGYTFGGWYKEDTYDNLWDFENDVVESSMTLHAKWDAKVTTVTLNKNGGANNGSVKLTYESSTATDYLAAVAKAGYELEGYYTSTSGGSKILNADGTLVSGSVADWLDDGKWIRWNNSELYAHWNLINYTITYNDLNGATNSNPTGYTVTSETIVLAAPGNRDGYRFGGWFTEADGAGTQVTEITAGSTGNKVVYAKWTLITYDDYITGCTSETEITAYGNEGLFADDATYCATTFTTDETPVICGVPTREGYTLDGFTITQNGTNYVFTYDGANCEVVDNLAGYVTDGKWVYDGTELDLYAHWTAKQYTLTLEANYVADPAIAAKTATVTYNATGTGSWTKHSRTGYTLDGYYTETEGGVMVINSSRALESSVVGYTDADGKWVRDEAVTLYAHWTINTFSVIWYDESGNEFASTTVDYGGNVDAPVGNPTCDKGKVFIGWTTSKTDAIQDSKPTQTNFPANNIRGDRKFYPIFASRNGGKEGAEAIGKSEDFSAVATTGSYGNGNWTAADGQTWNYTNMKIGKAGLIASNGIYFTGADGRRNATIVSATKIADASKVVLNIGRSGVVTATLDYSEDGSAWSSLPLTLGTTMADVEATLPQVGDYYIRLSVSVAGTQSVYVENIKVYTKARQWWYSDYSTNCNVAASATLTYAECDLAAHVASSIPENVTLPTPEKTGFVFKNWKCEQTGHKLNYDADATYVLAHDVTLTAIWTAKHTITYKEGDAEYTGEWVSDPHPTEFVEGVGCTLVDAQKDCYTFGGWYREADCSGTKVTKIATSVTTDEVLYAKFTQNTYKVTFNDNGHGTAPTALSDVPCGSTINDRKPADPTVSKWTFMGWYKENTCENAWDWENDVVTANTTLYAYWVSTTHTITCQTKTGDGVSECKTVADVAAGTSSVVITLDDACIPAGYHLYDWEYTLSGGGTTGVTKDVENKTFTITTMPDKDVTVTALLISDLVISGNPVKLTSGNGIAVYTTGDDRITVSGEDLWAVEKIKITYLKGGVEVAKTSSAFRLCDGDSFETMDGASGTTRTFNITDATRKPYSRVFAIQYQPTAANQMDDDYQLKLEAQLSNNNTVATAVFDLKGRSLPEQFAIVMKNDGDKNWYALPNDLDASTSAAASTKAPVVVMVDNQTTPTKVTFGPSNALYKADGRYEPTLHRGAIRFLKGDVASNAWITTSSTSQLFIPAYGADKQQFNLTSSNFSDYLIAQDGVDGYRISMYGGTIGWYNTGSNTKVYLLPVEAELLPKEADIIEWGANGLVVEVDATNVAGMIATVGSESTSQLAMNQTQTSAGSATKYDYTFNLGALSLTDKADQVMLLQWKNSSDVVIGTTMVKVPRIISGNVVASKDAATKSAWLNYDKIVVLPGAKLTVDGATSGFLNPTLKCVEVYPGGKLNIASGTVQTNTLILRAGWSSNKQWAMPNVAIANTATLTKTNAYLDWYVDYHQYYPIAVPFPVTVANMSYVNTKTAASAGVTIKVYDGKNRVDPSASHDTNNWMPYSGETLTPSTGYAMTAKRPTGKAWSIVRMPLTFTNAWTTNGEQAKVDAVSKNVVAVGAWGADDDSTPWYAKGWNFVANPFMVPFNSNDDGVTGKLSLQNGGSVKYATIPDLTFQNFDQVPFASANLQPMSGFFVQVAEAGNLEFVASGKQPIAAPMLAAQTEEVGLTAECYIRVVGNGEQDMFGLLIDDEYSAGYDVNADLAKMLGSANTLRAYMVYDDQQMAYVAINEELARELIPIVVRIPNDGEYRFELNDIISEIEDLDGLYLTDYQEDVTTNLLYDEYRFTANAGILSGRFALNASRKTPQIVTSIENGATMGNGERNIRKVIYDQKLFIVVDENVYDATGKAVK